MSIPTTEPPRTARAPPHARWPALTVVAVAQLMVALDATIVNIALPSAQADLDFGDDARQWVVTGYTCALAGLLLLGGRIADRIGRRRAFLGGLAGFSLASALAGAAPSSGLLVAGRAAQGAFAAVLTPTALSLIAVTFTRPRERARAFGVYGAVASSGAAIGLLLGGGLTEFAGWRWCLFVNVGIAGLAFLAGRAVLPAQDGYPATRVDARSALLLTGGLAAVALACSSPGASPPSSWPAPRRRGTGGPRRGSSCPARSGFSRSRCSCGGRRARPSLCCRCGCSTTGHGPAPTWRPRSPSSAPSACS